MKRLYKYILAVMFSLLAILGVCGGVDYKVDANENYHTVTFDYNISDIVYYLPSTSSLRDSLVNYMITVEDGDYAKETRTPHQSIFAYYSYEWTYNDVVVDIDSFAVTSDIVFKAKWSPRKYKVYFEFATIDIKNSITNRQDFIEFTVESGRINLYSPIRPNYNFQGWYDGVSNVPYLYIPARSIGDKILKARFSPTVYLIDYHTDAEVQNNSREYTIEDDKLPLMNPTKKGHIFKGWYSDADFTNRVYFIDCSKGGNLDFYPLWEKQTYEVTYILPNGISKTMLVDYGDTAELPDVQKSFFEIVKTDVSRKNITENKVIRVELVNIWYVYLIGVLLIVGAIVIIVLVKKHRHNTHNKLRLVYKSNVKNGRRKY